MEKFQNHLTKTSVLVILYRYPFGYGSLEHWNKLSKFPRKIFLRNFSSKSPSKIEIKKGFCTFRGTLRWESSKCPKISIYAHFGTLKDPFYIFRAFSIILDNLSKIIPCSIFGTISHLWVPLEICSSSCMQVFPKLFY